MARVTVEDCVDKVPNRFDLVLLAAQRAREISGGAELTIDRDRDKNPVVALREIADETVRPPQLREALVNSLQRVLPDDDDAVDEIGSLSQQAEAPAHHRRRPGPQYLDRRRLRRLIGCVSLRQKASDFRGPFCFEVEIRLSRRGQRPLHPITVDVCVTFTGSIMPQRHRPLWRLRRKR